MLSRIAESLYWIARYVERAEGTPDTVLQKIEALVDSSGCDEIITPNAWGNVVSPDCNADSPRSCWRGAVSAGSEPGRGSRFVVGLVCPGAERPKKESPDER